MRFIIKAKSLFPEVYPEREISSLKFSQGWFSKFVKRWNLSYRCASSVRQIIALDAKLLIKNLFEFFDMNCGQNMMTHDCVANMDETPVYFDMPKLKTYAVKGTKTVKIATTGRDLQWC